MLTRTKREDYEQKIEQASAELETLKAAVAEKDELLATAEAEKTAAVEALQSKLTEAEAKEKADSEAHASEIEAKDKAIAEAEASAEIKAAEIVASFGGSKPIAEASEKETTGDKLLQDYNAMTPGPEKQRFLAEHGEQLRKLAKTNQ